MALIEYEEKRAGSINVFFAGNLVGRIDTRSEDIKYFPKETRGSYIIFSSVEECKQYLETGEV